MSHRPPATDHLSTNPAIHLPSLLPDFVYFEVTAAEPYQIRKIEELNKVGSSPISLLNFVCARPQTNTGAVEAKVVCFYRRRDLSQELIQLADKHHSRLSVGPTIQDPFSTDVQEQQKDAGRGGRGDCPSTTPNLHTNTARQLHHRELFLSHHLETLPATHIRGKCTVTLHSDTEPWQAYLSREDSFFYQLVYDPLQKTLQADRGVIRQGADYQAEVADKFQPSDDSDSQELREELLWRPDNCVDPGDVDSYLLLSRSLGTLGRALHPTSLVRQPSLNMSMASAGRDSTLQLALDTLHCAGYQVPEALARLAPDNQPLLRLDELEQWSASEGNLFEEALDKYGKAFYDIQADFLPWKPAKSVIQFYYLWKTTDHYVHQRRIKASQAEHHLKQVYIPNYNKPNTSVLYPSSSATCSPGCEACPAIASAQWFALGPSGSPLLKVCTDCWAYWKRYADLKTVSLQDKLSNRSVLTKTLLATGNSSASNSDKVITMVNRASEVTATTVGVTSSASPSAVSQLTASGIAFSFITTPRWRAARQRAPRRLGRCPFRAIDPTPADTGLPTCPSADTPPHRSRAYTPRTALQQVIRRLSSELGQAVPNAVAAEPADIKRDSPVTCASPSRNSTISETAATITTTTTPVNGVAVESQANASGDKANCRKRTLATAGHVSDCEPADVKAMKTSPTGEQANKADGAKVLSVKSPSTAGVSAGFLVGPKRRVSLGGEHGTQTRTVMFRCHEALKRNRCRLLSIMELRYLGRRPLRSVFQPKSRTLNGLVGPTPVTAATSTPTIPTAVATTTSPCKASAEGRVPAKSNGTEQVAARPTSNPVTSDS